MSTFFSALHLLSDVKSPVRSNVLYIPYDQLNDNIGPLSRWKPEETTIIMFETSHKGTRRQYHKQKLAILLSNNRHFALEQAKRGVQVLYRCGTDDYGTLLSAIKQQYGIPEIQVMRPAERELRKELKPCIEAGWLTAIKHEGWLSTRQDLENTSKHAPWKMANFYQKMRKRTGILMENNKPIGGKYSFDGDNRLAWKGDPEVPAIPTFEADDITSEVCDFIESSFPDAVGKLDRSQVPATKADAAKLWAWAKQECMVHFGPYEDAMHTDSKSLFHTRISPLLNLHRLLPKQVVQDIEQLDIPFNSKEGFIRQVLGWREFMYQIHEYTDGLRRIPNKDGTWTEHPTVQIETDIPKQDGGTLINVLGYQTPLPDAFWGKKCGLNCLDSVVKDVMDDGFTHHIPRLMVLANIATLLEIKPREITDWFWVSFIDAFDWVVEPNVLAMGTFATGEVLSTKPYIAGAGYINKMSNFCKGCTFNPKKNCPLTRLYWAYLDNHRERFKDNFRMKMVLRSLDKRSDIKKATDRAIFTWMVETLAKGEVLSLQNMPTEETVSVLEDQVQ